MKKKLLSIFLCLIILIFGTSVFDLQCIFHSIAVHAAEENDETKHKLDKIVGTYHGIYSATQGNTGLSLYVKEISAGKFKAEFYFYALPENPGVPTGKYTMNVTYTSTANSYFFKADTWVTRPSGYGFVDLKGTLADNLLSGDVLDGSSRKIGVFRLNKVYDSQLESFLGSYEGKYTAQQGVTGLTLNVTRADDGRYTAVFNFFGVPENPKVPSGRYITNVIFDSKTNKYLLKGDRWLEKPNNYHMVDLIGGFDGKCFSGDVLIGIDYNITFSLGGKTGGFKLVKTSNTLTSQRQRNIEALLKTKLNGISYWEYFAETAQWPAYKYLNDYYNAKDSWEFSRDLESLFRKYVGPSIIMTGDRLHNDGAFTNQSKERAKQIMIALTKDTSSSWVEDAFSDENFKMIESYLKCFEDAIISNDLIYTKGFDKSYTMLQNRIDDIRRIMRNDVMSGSVPTIGRLLQIAEIDVLNNFKATLVKVLEENEKIFQTEKLEKISKKLNLTLNVFNMSKLALERYQMLNSLLQANSDFIDALDLLTTSSTSEVSEAAKELRDYYQKGLNGEVNVLISSLGDASYSQLGDMARDWIIEKNPIAQLTNDIIGSLAKTGDKIEEFENLRLAVAMSKAFDNKLQELINEFKLTKSASCIDSIYKFAPFILALRKNSEDYLCKYITLLDPSNEKRMKSHLEDVSSILNAFHNTLYSDKVSTVLQEVDFVTRITPEEEVIGFTPDGSMYITEERRSGGIRFNFYDLITQELEKTIFLRCEFYRSEAGRNYNIVWNKRGDKFLFTSPLDGYRLLQNGLGSTDIYLCDLEKEKIECLTSDLYSKDSYANIFPSFSEDNKVYYYSFDPRLAEQRISAGIYSIDLSTKEKQFVTSIDSNFLFGMHAFKTDIVYIQPYNGRKGSELIAYNIITKSKRSLYKLDSGYMKITDVKPDRFIVQHSMERHLIFDASYKYTELSSIIEGNDKFYDSISGITKERYSIYNAAVSASSDFAAYSYKDNLMGGKYVFVKAGTKAVKVYSDEDRIMEGEEPEALVAAAPIPLNNFINGLNLCGKYLIVQNGENTYDLYELTDRYVFKEGVPPEIVGKYYKDRNTYLRLKSDGTWVIIDNYKIDAAGTFTVDGDEITIYVAGESEDHRFKLIDGKIIIDSTTTLTKSERWAP